MKHRVLKVGLAGVGLLGLFVSLFIATPSAQGRRRIPQLERAAEWGVWKVQDGRVTSLQELAAELPSFVHRGVSAAAPSEPPHVVHRPVTARKPVLYLYSGETCWAPTVRVQVTLPVGGETLHYPRGTTATRSLSFRGRLFPLRSRSQRCNRPQRHARFQAAPRGHFWNDLRRVPASVFQVGSEAERFIFYDGLTEMRSPYVFYGADDHAAVAPRPGRTPQAGVDDVVYALHGRSYRRLTLASGVTQPTPLTSGDERPKTRLERDLREQLLARGLTRPEAQSLLDTWRPDLVDADGDRRIYFVDRADYDQMLPLTIYPRPRQLVRVGVVIEEL